jgi:hypothetical protein
MKISPVIAVTALAAAALAAGCSSGSSASSGCTLQSGSGIQISANEACSAMSANGSQLLNALGIGTRWSSVAGPTGSPQCALPVDTTTWTIYDSGNGLGADACTVLTANGYRVTQISGGAGQ